MARNCLRLLKPRWSASAPCWRTWWSKRCQGNCWTTCSNTVALWRMALALAAVDNVGERLLRSRINAVHSYKHKMCRTTVAYAGHDEESRDFRPLVSIIRLPIAAHEAI